MKLEIYKRGQGKYTRWITFGAVVALGVIGAVVLSEVLEAYLPGAGIGVYLQFGIPVLVVVALAAVMFWLMNRPKTADFLIATEGEMKKVSWSSRKEVVGSTKVVIVTTLIMAATLFAVDQLFTLLFQTMGILPSK